MVIGKPLGLLSLQQIPANQHFHFAMSKSLNLVPNSHSLSFLYRPSLSTATRSIDRPLTVNCRFTAKEFASEASASIRNPKASLYDVLKVKRNASLSEIKKAYRRLAKLYHPDVAASSSEDDFISIHNAYLTLSDPTGRALYDMSLGLGGRERGIRAMNSFASNSYGGGGGRRSSRFYSYGSWETDQCW